MELVPQRLLPSFSEPTISSGDGSIAVNIFRAWAPLGVDRLYELVTTGFFNNTAFFRYVPDFIVQFGISGDSRVSAIWSEKPRRGSHYCEFLRHNSLPLRSLIWRWLPVPWTWEIHLSLLVLQDQLPAYVGSRRCPCRRPFVLLEQSTTSEIRSWWTRAPHPHGNDAENVEAISAPADLPVAPFCGAPCR